MEHNYLKTILSHTSKYKKILVFALLLATINQVFSLLDPYVFKIIVDDYAMKFSTLTQAAFIKGVVILLVIAMGCAFVSRVAKNFQDYFLSLISQRVGAELYSKSVEHVFSLPYHIFEDQRSGSILQKLQKAKQDIQLTIANLVNVAFFSIVGIIFVLVYAFATHWIIGVAYLLSMPIIALSTFFISKRIKTAQKSVLAETTELAGMTTETLRNVELVKSSGLEEQEITRLNNSTNKILDLELKKIKLVRKLSFIQGTIINATRTAIIFALFFLIFKEQITIGEYFTLMIYSFFLFNPLSQLGDVASQYQEAKASYEQLDTILKIPSKKKVVDPQETGTLETIKFKDLSFAYESNEIDSVNNINLEIKKGETVAFVGPSGAGKSTMVKLLVGLYEPTKGKMLINDIDSTKIDYTNFRKKIGLVSQDTQLFAGTIRENLLFVKPDATDEECLTAIKKASAFAIIERTGKMLDTKIGEGGIKISGGEKQRIAIARALLRKPELVIFDEATSSLDSLTEKEITKTIQEITHHNKELTVVLIAHRLSTIAHADKIVVLEKGKIAETGTHHQLLAKRGLYEAFWKQQQASVDEK